ncbi:hypothetical protein OIE63_17605 [Streptomyces sp. NBC_01795]|uniref:hypothetical protein n=1 Tax=Streptomyces sp. NBC_01795 TaxID=2975943 RepID=UPI002DDBD656|nr:hypothetical protein [Streptomyces sp. NBC_01795]WSA93192.1 hypothetical protein OIE63_17605 [Streptomyces sp. NBC_01795]
MSISEQYAMDVWRLRGQGVPEPPAPGTHEARILRAWWVARKEARKELGKERSAGRGGEPSSAAPVNGPVAHRPPRGSARRA